MIDRLTTYQRNVWPAMVDDLATELGVSAESLCKLGVGWYPAEGCWVFPERDAQGNVVGLVRRFRDGKKRTTTGSKRGLTYCPCGASVTYQPGAGNWVHVEKGYTCPICGKEDWCLVSSENPTDPKAVICGRVAVGAAQSLGDAGYLHIRKPEGVVRTGSLLPPSELPILLVEGQSDVAAAMDLGFVAVGRPSARGGQRFLAELLAGLPVVVLGENDSGAGALGMEATFAAVRKVASSCVKLLPPAGIKDLRAWKLAGLTHNTLIEAIAHGDAALASSTLEDGSPLAVAELWLSQCHSHDGLPLLRRYRDRWLRWNGRHYAPVDEAAAIRGRLYAFLQDKQVQRTRNGKPVVEPFEPNMGKVSNIIDALSMTCPIDTDPPVWLDARETPAPENLLTFANGILDLASGDLLTSTPSLWVTTSLAFDYDPNQSCPLWLRFLEQIFPDDSDKALLLQEWFGYNMIPDTSMEKLMVMVGRPGAGKGTTLDALRAVLGDGQVASSMMKNLTADFSIDALTGTLALILPDAHLTNKREAEAVLELLKAISGRDRMNVRRKYKSELLDRRLPCRITLTCNDLPQLPDHARALERRLLLIHFNESFAGREDASLKDRIAAEAPGIAIWALEGLTRLRKTGKFTTPKSSGPMIQSFHRMTSPITEFVDDVCKLGPDEWVPKQLMYDLWCAWAKAHGERPMTRTVFTQRVEMLFPGLAVSRRTINGEIVIGWRGVAPTDHAVKRYLIRGV